MLYLRNNIYLKECSICSSDYYDMYMDRKQYYSDTESEYESLGDVKYDAWAARSSIVTRSMARRIKKKEALKKVIISQAENALLKKQINLALAKDLEDRPNYYESEDSDAGKGRKRIKKRRHSVAPTLITRVEQNSETDKPEGHKLHIKKMQHRTYSESNLSELVTEENNTQKCVTKPEVEKPTVSVNRRKRKIIRERRHSVASVFKKGKENMSTCETLNAKKVSRRRYSESVALFAQREIDLNTDNSDNESDDCILKKNSQKNTKLLDNSFETICGVEKLQGSTKLPEVVVTSSELKENNNNAQLKRGSPSRKNNNYAKNDNNRKTKPTNKPSPENKHESNTKCCQVLNSKQKKNYAWFKIKLGSKNMKKYQANNALQVEKKNSICQEIEKTKSVVKTQLKSKPKCENQITIQPKTIKKRRQSDYVSFTKPADLNENLQFQETSINRNAGTPTNRDNINVEETIILRSHTKPQRIRSRRHSEPSIPTYDRELPNTTEKDYWKSNFLYPENVLQMMFADDKETEQARKELIKILEPSSEESFDDEETSTNSVVEIHKDGSNREEFNASSLHNLFLTFKKYNKDTNSVICNANRITQTQENSRSSDIDLNQNIDSESEVDHSDNMTKMEHYYNYKKRIIYQHERPSTPLPSPHPTTEEEEDSPLPPSPASSCSSVHSNYCSEKKKEEITHPKVARKRAICRSQFRHEKLELFKLGTSIPTSLCKTKEPYNVCTEKNLQLCCQNQKNGKKIKEHVDKESITASIINTIEGTKRKDVTLWRPVSLDEKNEKQNKDSNISDKDKNKPLSNGRHILPAVVLGTPIRRRNTISEENKERSSIFEKVDQSNKGDQELQTDQPVIRKASPLSINRLKPIKRRRKTITGTENLESQIQGNEPVRNTESDNLDSNKLSLKKRRNSALIECIPLEASSNSPLNLSLKNNYPVLPAKPMIGSMSNRYKDPRLNSKNKEQFCPIISKQSSNITKKPTQLRLHQESLGNCVATSGTLGDSPSANKHPADISFPEIEQQMIRMGNPDVHVNQNVMPSMHNNVQPESTIRETLILERQAKDNTPKQIMENHIQQHVRVENVAERDLQFEKTGKPDVRYKKSVQTEPRSEKNLLPDKVTNRVSPGEPDISTKVQPTMIIERTIQTGSLVNLPVIDNSTVVDDEEVIRSILQLVRSTMEPNFTVEIWLVLNKWSLELHKYLLQPTLSQNLKTAILNTFNEVLIYITQKLFDMSLAEVSTRVLLYTFVDNMMGYDLAPCKALIITFLPMLRSKVNMEHNMRSLLTLVEKTTKKGRRRNSNIKPLIINRQYPQNAVFHAPSIDPVTQNSIRTTIDFAKPKQNHFSSSTSFDPCNTLNKPPPANFMTNIEEFQRNGTRRLTPFQGHSVVEPQRNDPSQLLYPFPYTNIQRVSNEHPKTNHRAENYNMQPNVLLPSNVRAEIYNTRQNISNSLHLENNNFRDNCKLQQGHSKAQSGIGLVLENSNGRLENCHIPFRLERMHLADNRCVPPKTNHVINHGPDKTKVYRCKQKDDCLEIIPIVPPNVSSSQVVLSKSVIPRKPLEICSEKSVIMNSKAIHQDINDQKKDTAEPKMCDVSKITDITESNQTEDETTESCSEADVEEFLQTNVILNKSRTSLSNQDCDPTKEPKTTETNPISESTLIENTDTSKTDKKIVDKSVEKVTKTKSRKTSGNIRILSNTVIVRDKSMEITRGTSSEDMPCDNIIVDKTRSSEEVVVEKVPASGKPVSIASISISTSDGIESKQNKLQIKDGIQFDKPATIFNCIKQSLRNLKNIEKSAENLQDISLKIVSDMPKPKISPPKLIKLIPFKRKENNQNQEQRKKLKPVSSALSDDEIIVIEDDDKDDNVFEDTQNKSDCNQNYIIERGDDEEHSTDDSKQVKKVKANDDKSPMEQKNLSCATQQKEQPVIISGIINITDSPVKPQHSLQGKIVVPEADTESIKKVGANNRKSPTERTNLSCATPTKKQPVIISEIIEINDSPVKPRHSSPQEVQRIPIIEDISSDEESVESFQACSTSTYGDRVRGDIKKVLLSSQVSHCTLIDDNVELIKQTTKRHFTEKPLVYTRPVLPQEVVKYSPTETQIAPTRSDFFKKQNTGDKVRERQSLSNIAHFEEDCSSLTCHLKVKSTSELTYTTPRTMDCQGLPSVCRLPIGRGFPLSPSHLEDSRYPRRPSRTSPSQDSSLSMETYPNRSTPISPVVPLSPLLSGSPGLHDSRANWKNWFAEEHRRGLLNFSRCHSIGSNSPSRTLSRRQSIETTSSVGSDYCARFLAEDTNYCDIKIDSKVYRLKRSVYEKIPKGKLCYIRESNTFIRYFDDNQMELFLRNFEGSSAASNILKQIKGRTGDLSDTDLSLALSETSSKSEIISLSKNVSFSSEDFLSDPEQYVEEVEKVERFVPKDFYGFYKFVTGYQIVHYHPPISFQTFLTMHNTNGIRGLFKNYINTLIEGQNMLQDSYKT